jgi:alkylation response protein AidB-like acyl-CoA dehydrogenase
MDFNPTEDQKMLRESVRRFVRERYPLASRRRPAATAAVEAGGAHWKQYAQMGWLGLSLPSDAGGLGLSFLETAIVAEELGRGMAPGPFIPSAVLCARIIERCPAAADRVRLLGDLVNGVAIVCLAHAEEGMRYDTGTAGAVTAERRDGKFVLNGRKMLAVAAPCADWMIVSARLASEQRGDFALFLLKADEPGVKRRDYQLIDHSPASDIELQNVVLAGAAMMAAPDRSPAILEDALDRAALAAVAEAMGSMEAVFQVTLEHLKTRVQFGKPIGRFQALQHRVAEMFVEMHESRSQLYRGLAHIESPPRERAAAVSAAKAFVGPAAKRVGQQAIQLHGGMGITEEHVVGEFYRRIFVFEKLYGDTDHHFRRLMQSEFDDVELETSL